MEWSLKSLAKWTSFNRRNFIKLLIGGAAGIHLTPLPWKLMDDIAIWTQNWPWIPIPPKGSFTRAASVCQLCPGGCGIEVRKVDERAVKIEGRTDFPVNPGGICPLGAGGLQLLYDQNIRFTGPMKRVGPRGSGDFVEISWNDAIKEVTDRISTLRKQDRPEALAAVDGSGADTTMSVLVQRFLEACGSPNYVRMPSAQDTYTMANRIMAGNDGPMAYDLENADFILSFGCGLIEGWGAPGRMLHAWGLWNQDAQNKKVRVVQVEPRASTTASKADQWIAPLPGTEGALALGIAHVMIKEKLFDAAFVADNGSGFSDWTSPDGKSHKGFGTVVLQKYPPESVAKITGLDPGEIVSLARAFARAKAPVALCGKGKGTLSGSLLEFMAVQSLNALAGNINKPGGVFLVEPLPFSPLPLVEKDAVASEGVKKVRLDLAGTHLYPYARSLLNNFAETILKSPASPVDVLLVFGSNPAYDFPHTGLVSYAIEKIPYIVSFSPFKDETALMADLVLPDHTYLEKQEEIVWPTGLQYPLCSISRPVVKPLYDTRQSGDVLIGMALAIGGTVGASFPWKSFEEVLKARFEGVFKAGGGTSVYKEAHPPWKRSGDRAPTGSEEGSFDEMWKRMSKVGFWHRPSREHTRGSVFKTASGKFEFYGTGFEQAYEMPKAAEQADHYPLLLLPYERINMSSGSTPNPPYLQKTLFDDQLRKEAAFADMNPQTARLYGIRQGDAVLVESKQGRLPVRVNLTEGAMPGVLFLALGLGRKGLDPSFRGKGVNPGEIMNGRKDPKSGQVVWWDTKVKVTKV
jgi:menaquinone reductase, molybdopterin-binding-like subunit